MISIDQYFKELLQIEFMWQFTEWHRYMEDRDQTEFPKTMTRQRYSNDQTFHLSVSVFFKSIERCNTQWVSYCVYDLKVFHETVILT